MCNNVIIMCVLVIICVLVMCNNKININVM